MLWDEAEPIAGTLAIDYLTFRHIDVDQLTDGPEAVLRFHPNCPFDGPVRVPCLLALYQDIDTNAFAGIHRIALTPGAFTRPRFSSAGWAAGHHGAARQLWPAQRVLVLGRDSETTLAAATRAAHRGHPRARRGAMPCRCDRELRSDRRRWLVVLLADNEPVGQQAAQMPPNC